MADPIVLLLAITERRVERLTPSKILRRYLEDRLVRPSAHDPEPLDELEQLAFSLLSRFERLELSPVAPLGTCSKLADASPQRVLATTRGSEVVSDPTNVLALECAVRRRADRTGVVRLCTVQRVLRTQEFSPPWPSHFRLLAFCSAGRAGDEEELLAEQVEACVRTLERAGASEIAVDREPRKQAYYSGATYAVSAIGAELVEGGFVDWTQKLLSDRKERLLIGGLGIEALASTLA